MGNVCSCHDWWIQSQINNIKIITQNVIKLRDRKERTIQLTLNQYQASVDKCDKDGEDLYKSLVCSLTEEKQNLSRVILMLSKMQGKLEQLSIDVRTTDELEVTKELLNMCVEYVQTGGITRSQVDALFDVAKDAECEMFVPDESGDEKEPVFEEILARRAVSALPSVPSSDMTRNAVYESI